MLFLTFWSEGSSTTKRGLFVSLSPPVSFLGPRRTSKTANKTIVLYTSNFPSAASHRECGSSFVVVVAPL